MIAADIETGIARLRDLVDAAEVIVPFTGAGISTECGIPDFRSPGGLWTRNRPIPFDEFVASPEARDEAWRRRFAMEPTFAAAKPGRGHRALASLYRAGKTPAIITQNIDNLHQASGFKASDVIELHGNTTYARCIGCGQAYGLPWVNALAPNWLSSITNRPTRTTSPIWSSATTSARRSGRSWATDARLIRPCASLFIGSHESVFCLCA